jgi:predicted ATPase
LPATKLSDGTRLILCMLTIIHQEHPPAVVLLEDVDRGMHPRLFQDIAPLMRRIAMDNGINIIATTHNPYLVDAFQDAKECVLLVEKIDGASVLNPLPGKLAGLDYEHEEAAVPLGHLWYSGLIGGVPLRLSP